MTLAAPFRLISNNPLVLLLFFLATSFSFILGHEAWWLFQLMSQCLLLALALIFPRLRLTALLLMSFLLFNSVFWFIPSVSQKSECLDNNISITGNVKNSSFENRDSIKLIRAVINCGKAQVKRPFVKIDLGSAELKGWFIPGDEIEVSRLNVDSLDLFGTRLTISKRSRVKNLRYAQATLNRGSLLLFIQKKADYHLSPFSSALFKSLVTADKSGFDKSVKTGFQELGISHLFAISGLHIGMIYLWLVFIFSKAGILFKNFRMGSHYPFFADLLSIILIYYYLKVIGMPLTALRSLIMLSWWVLVRHFLPWQSLWFVLLGTACVILIDQPTAIASLSFQLSFIAVTGILTILPFLPNSDMNDSLHQKITKYFISTLLISSWLFILMLPLSSQINQSHSLFSAPSNLLHIFFMSLCYLPLALAVMGLLTLSYPF
ncbi:MAG: ComEC/Rec2 family competence protein, partial [Deltaproteobacteria bacterium]|nr:ComEC/Rec2 family competence protein [Deltaproteobacteria bacterium]